MFLIYPEPRHISDEEIAAWYADAVANKAVDHSLRHAKTPAEMAAALEDAGLITLGTPNKDVV